MTAAPEPVRFYFDPICPWAYQTSRWARRVHQLGRIQLSWGVFSLELANANDPKQLAKGAAKSTTALRAVLLVREHAGDEGIDRFYAALGERVHQRQEPLEENATVAAALDDAGLPSGLAAAAATDDDLGKHVAEEHWALVDQTRSFGVPTIVLDGGSGPAIFGPVISVVPDDDEAVALWEHVSWLTRYGNFSELKRDRTLTPDLPAFHA